VLYNLDTDYMSIACEFVLQFSVKVVATEHAKHFLDLTTFPVPVLEDADEWKVECKHTCLGVAVTFPSMTSAYVSESSYARIR